MCMISTYSFSVVIDLEPLLRKEKNQTRAQSEKHRENNQQQTLSLRHIQLVYFLWDEPFDFLHLDKETE